MNEKIFDELFTEVKSGTKLAFENIQANHKGEGIASFALYSDNDALTICTTACTQAHFDNLEDWMYFEEWDCDWEEIDCLDKATDVLSRIHEVFDQTLDSNPEEKHEDLWRANTNLIFVTIVKALKSLLDEGLFGSEGERERFFLNFDISDSGVSDEDHKNWVRQLNTENVFNEYKSKA